MQIETLNLKISSPFYCVSNKNCKKYCIDFILTMELSSTFPLVLHVHVFVEGAFPIAKA